MQLLRLLPLAALVLVPACSLFELSTVLRPRGSFREGAPEGDARVHAPGVRCTLECAYVEEDEGLVPRTGFQLTIQISNDGPDPVHFDWRSFELIDDRDVRYPLSHVLRWDEEDEEWRPAAEQLERGGEEALVALFPSDGPVNLQRMFRLTMRWAYRVRGDRYVIRSTFDVQ